MQCYTEVVPPSGVTQALALPFTSSNASNLIVGRTSLLQVFAHKQLNQGQDTKLILLAEYHLSGTITAFGRVSIPSSKSGGEALIVAFRNAKLSLVEWDPNQHSISTVSIHYYENYDLQAAPWMPDLQDCVNRLTVDPGSRCAAFNFGVSSLAIIPFHQARDDLAMDDFDESEDENTEKSLGKPANGEADGHDTPYFPSFVLPLTVLDPGLIHPVDLAFLHEYRDPTVGILYSSVARSENMAHERKDVTIYAVYALDLEQKASTTLQSVQSLPNDLYAVVALPLPVGGALLVGGNELIHIDQGGKASAVGVNEFARECSSFPMADHAEYQMKLEGCQIEHLGSPNGDMLVILNTGELVILTFRLDGRSVSGMSLRRVEGESVQDILRCSSSCTAHLGHGRVFVGSEAAPSVLLGTTKRGMQPKRQSSRAQLQSSTNLNSDEDDENEDMDEDDVDDDGDLYAEIASARVNGGPVEITISSSNIRLLDQLPCIAPMHDVAFGRCLKRKREDDDDESPISEKADQLELAVACGTGKAGGVAFFSRQLRPRINKLIRRGNAMGVWSFTSEKQLNPKDEEVIHDHVILSETAEEDSGQSSLWTLSEGELQAKEGTEFDGSAGATIEVGRLLATNHTAQVTPIEVRVYDSDFGLSQIFLIVDEEEGQMAKAVHASFAEPYVVLLKDDNTIMLLKADRTGELDEVELPRALGQKSIISAGLYTDTADFFHTSRFQRSKSATSENILLSLLTSDGIFCLLPLPNMSIQVFQADGLQFLPAHLAQDSQLPKHWRNQDELAEAIIADLGDSVDQHPYLIVRNTTGDITVYQPFAVPGVVGTYRFRKIAIKNAESVADSFPNEEDDASQRPAMQILKDFSGYIAVFVPGSSPSIILKHAHSVPRIYDFGFSEVKSICGLRDEVYGHDLILVDAEGDLRIGTLPPKAIIGDSDWVVEKVDLHQDITAIAYFEPSQSYVLGANNFTEFQLPQDDEWHPEWKDEKMKFLPTNIQSSLKLLSSKTHSIISQYHFEVAERVLCIKAMNLEVSEETHERKDLIVVGTAVAKGENVVTRGNLYIFDVVDVVPQLGVPESDLKLKLITKEDVRGAVTAISTVGSQGFILAAQGQKCMVRGLKEDMSILPVAFMDMRYYLKVAKELKGTGMCILGDAFSGMWLMGYSEEPYKMQLLGRDLDNPDVLAAEFLPDGKQLYIITSDGDGQLRLLQYDPENPKADRGTKLLPRSTFNTGALPTTMTLLPRTPVSSEIASSTTQVPPSPSSDSMSVDVPAPVPIDYATNQILVTTQSGSLALITTLSDTSYRRLSTLQNILITNLEHPCGLNPRAYRAVETDGVGGRGMIDGNLVTRWLMQSSQHKSSTADKVGGTLWEVRGDLEGVGGSGLGFL